MAREPQPRQTDVKKQVKIGLKLTALATLLIAMLVWCLSGPIRRWTLDQPVFDAQPPQRLPEPAGALAAGNLDGNAWDDLAVSSAPGSSSRITVHLGGESGPRLDAPLDLPEAFGALDLVLADLDGDGLDEIIATPAGEQSRGFAIWWNEGQGRFRRAGVPLPLRLIDVADDDGDGAPEIVGVTRDHSAIQVHRVSGQEVALNATVTADLYDNSVRDIAAAQLDRGGLDLALVARDRVRLFRSGGLVPDPTSHFNLPVRSIRLDRSSPATPSLVLGDLNSDGRPDLAVLDDRAIRLQLGLGGGTFTEARLPLTGQPALRLISGDFDGDGRADLMTVALDAQTVQCLLRRR